MLVPGDASMRRYTKLNLTRRFPTVEFRQHSGTLNPPGVRKVADVLRPKFESLGFTCRWIPMEEVHRAGHMLCTHDGNRGKRVLLIGHMDTVFEADSPFQRFEQTPEKTTGPGAADMKGG